MGKIGLWRKMKCICGRAYSNLSVVMNGKARDTSKIVGYKARESVIPVFIYNHG